MLRGLVVLLLVAALAGCSDARPKALDGQETLAPGAIKEINVHLEEGKRVEWSWTASEPVTFNVHSHVSETQVAMHVERTGASDAGHFTAPSDGEYSLMWENGASSVELSFGVRVYGRVLDP